MYISDESNRSNESDKSMNIFNFEAQLWKSGS